MNITKVVIPVMVAGVILAPAATAQNALQNWATNELNKINQGASSGMLNGSQAAGLQARDAQIMQQAQNDMNANGGTLTGGQQRQISRELRGLNRTATRDARMNNPALMNNPYYANQNNAGYMNPAYQQWRTQGMGWGGYQPAVNPVTGQPIPPMGTNPNGYPHRHHHHNWN